MISHQEAQSLISERQDRPIDPVVERALRAHLATCDECRAFANSVDRLTTGLQQLPYLPASPAVRRDVMARIERGRNPLAGLFGGLSLNPVPALSALAVIALIALLGYVAIDRFMLDGSQNNQEQHLLAPPTSNVVFQSTERATVTPVPTATSVPPTQTPVPTATTAPPTETPAPTATTAPPTETPAPTATTAPPTETPAPTATTAPPTETAAPTATTAPPTETAAPTATEPAVTETPTDLSGGTDPSTPTAPTPTPTQDATEAPAPTATSNILQLPTVGPTSTPGVTATPSPTMTPSPTAPPSPAPSPVPTQTAAPIPTETPRIEPINTTDQGGTTDTSPSDSSTANPGPTIQPVGVTDSTEEAVAPATTSETTPAPTGTSVTTAESTRPGIEPLNGTATSEATDEASSASSTETPDTTQNLADGSTAFGGIEGDASGRLWLTPDGRLVYSSDPDGVSTTDSTYGTTVSEGDGTTSGLQICDGDGQNCTGLTEIPADAGWQSDSVIAVDGNVWWYVRSIGGSYEYHAVTVDGTSVVSDTLLTTSDSAPAAAWTYQGTVYVWTPTGQWLALGSDSASTASLPSAPALARFQNGGSGPLITYSDGSGVVIAPASDPGAAVYRIASPVVDFDLSPGGDRVAISTGSSIEIYDLQGNMLQRWESDSVAPGTITWLNGGIVYQDQNSGTLYQIPDTAN